MHIFFISIVYTIVLVFILTVIYLKIKRKEKYTSWLWGLFCYVVVLPILYFSTIGYFSPSSSSSTLNVEILNVDTLNVK
jgi:hypothetical protein